MYDRHLLLKSLNVQKVPKKWLIFMNVSKSSKNGHFTVFGHFLETETLLPFCNFFLQLLYNFFTTFYNFSQLFTTFYNFTNVEQAVYSVTVLNVS